MFDWQALHDGTNLLRRRKIVHAFPPAAERRELWVHRLRLGGQAERKGGRQQIAAIESSSPSRKFLPCASSRSATASPVSTLGSACATTFSSEAMPSSGKTKRSCVTW